MFNVAQFPCNYITRTYIKFNTSLLHKIFVFYLSITALACFSLSSWPSSRSTCSLCFKL